MMRYFPELDTSTNKITMLVRHESERRLFSLSPYPWMRCLSKSRSILKLREAACQAVEAASRTCGLKSSGYTDFEALATLAV